MWHVACVASRVALCGVACVGITCRLLPTSTAQKGKPSFTRTICSKNTSVSLRLWPEQRMCEHASGKTMATRTHPHTPAHCLPATGVQPEHEDEAVVSAHPLVAHGRELLHTGRVEHVDHHHIVAKSELLPVPAQLWEEPTVKFRSRWRIKIEDRMRPPGLGRQRTRLQWWGLEARAAAAAAAAARAHKSVLLPWLGGEARTIFRHVVAGDELKHNSRLAHPSWPADCTK